MHDGAGAGLVLNRFYYQVTIPIKDAAILANMPFAYGVGHRKD